MFISINPSFTVRINYETWVGKGNVTGGIVLMNYIEDVLSALPIDSGATAALIQTSPVLAFTFTNNYDAELCKREIEKIWQEGGWMSDGI